MAQAFLETVSETGVAPLLQTAKAKLTFQSKFAVVAVNKHVLWKSTGLLHSELLGRPPFQGVYCNST